MARMHSRKRGRSSSTQPFRTDAPEWVDMDQKEIEETIVNLAKAGTSSSKIGTILRDQYGIPSVKLVMGKSMYQVLMAHDMQTKIPEDLSNLMKRAVNLHEHLQKNTKDLHNRRNLHLIEAKIRRMIKYYQRSNRIAKDWKYSLANAKLLVE